MKGLLTIQFKNGPDFGGIKREFVVTELETGASAPQMMEFWTDGKLLGFNGELIAWYEFTPTPEQTTLEGVKG